VARRVVITGAGVISPIGQDLPAVWRALVAGTSGVGPIRSIDVAALPVRIAGEVPAFDAKKIITDREERKSLKMMSRTVQMGVACARLAFADAALARGQLDPARFGVEIGSGFIATDHNDLAAAANVAATDAPGGVDLAKWGAEGLPLVPPLWMLKYLPNMVACNASIFLDARGPNNSITQSDAAGLLALGEAARIIRRDRADFMLVAAADSKISMLGLLRQCVFAELSHRNDEPAKACRPFDVNRDGWVIAEGAGAFTFEDLAHADRRGAHIVAEVVGFGSSYDRGRTGAGLARAIRTAFAQARVGPDDIDHVNAHGMGAREGDAWEARGLAEVFGPNAPVFAPKSYLGNLGPAGGLVELTASLLALKHRTLPATLNCDNPDPGCPVAVVRRPRPVTKPYILKISLTDRGQCAAAVLRRWDE
jgi:3-oxoacyl-[acyl-carrier-protein] synthase II